VQHVVDWSVHSFNKQGDVMNMYRDSSAFGVPREALKPKKVGLMRRFLRLLVQILSSPNGDQGGWEGGARGL
jgi:hypothetical protein